MRIGSWPKYRPLVKWLSFYFAQTNWEKWQSVRFKMAVVVVVVMCYVVVVVVVALLQIYKNGVLQFWKKLLDWKSSKNQEHHMYFIVEAKFHYHIRFRLMHLRQGSSTGVPRNPSVPSKYTFIVKYRDNSDVRISLHLFWGSAKHLGTVRVPKNQKGWEPLI